MLRNLAGLLALTLALGCGRTPARMRSDAGAELEARVLTNSAASRAQQVAPEPTELLKLPLAAFHVRLAADRDAIYMLTASAAYRFAPDEVPRQFTLDLGEGPVLTSTSFVFWSKGAIWRAPKLGGEPQKLASVPHKPQYFATSGDYFVWLDRTDDGHCTIRTLDGRKQRIVYEASGELDAVTMINDWAFFAERAGDAHWRLGGIRRGGGQAAYSALKEGRSPATLVANQDEIYYYDINKFEFRKVSPDLHDERVILANFVCSPIALSERIHCGQVEGLVQLPLEAPYQPRLLTPGRNTLITAIAANSKQVVWVIDAGPDKLAVRALPIAVPE